jgi:hypothetical protein
LALSDGFGLGQGMGRGMGQRLGLTGNGTEAFSPHRPGIGIGSPE